jgi:hypothetical protein
MNSLRVFRIDGSVYFIPITFSSQEEFDSAWSEVERHLGGIYSVYAVRVLDCDGEILQTVSITTYGFKLLNEKFYLCMELEDYQTPPVNPPRNEAAEFRAMVEMHKHWLRAHGG